MNKQIQQYQQRQQQIDRLYQAMKEAQQWAESGQITPTELRALRQTYIRRLARAKSSL